MDMLNTVAVVSTLGSFTVGAMCYALLRTSTGYQQFFESRALTLAAPRDPGLVSPVAEILSVSVRRLIAVLAYLAGPGTVYAFVRWMLPQRLPQRFGMSVAPDLPSLDILDTQAWIWTAVVVAFVLAYYIARRAKATPDPDIETDPPVLEWTGWALIANLSGLVVHTAAVEWILRGVLFALLLPAGADLAIAVSAVLYGLSRLPDGAVPAFGGLVLSTGAGLLVVSSGSLLPVIVGHSAFAVARFFVALHRNPTVSFYR
ncbi:MAG: CPBP family intramembrane metalloprotease [Spirochaetaceae bacterium]|nr:MAG: CPBP family intramembrane metalloprotease [Spirochaetaceae bacterium]